MPSLLIVLNHMMVLLMTHSCQDYSLWPSYRKWKCCTVIEPHDKIGRAARHAHKSNNAIVCILAECHFLACFQAASAAMSPPCMAPE